MIIVHSYDKYYVKRTHPHAVAFVALANGTGIGVFYDEADFLEYLLTHPRDSEVKFRSYCHYGTYVS